MTSLSNVDLYENLWEKCGISAISKTIPLSSIQSWDISSRVSCRMQTDWQAGYSDGEENT
jgi:hypothetical protein